MPPRLPDTAATRLVEVLAVLAVIALYVGVIVTLNSAVVPVLP